MFLAGGLNDVDLNPGCISRTEFSGANGSAGGCCWNVEVSVWVESLDVYGGAVVLLERQLVPEGGLRLWRPRSRATTLEGCHASCTAAQECCWSVDNTLSEDDGRSETWRRTNPDWKVRWKVRLSSRCSWATTLDQGLST